MRKFNKAVCTILALATLATTTACGGVEEEAQASSTAEIIRCYNDDGKARVMRVEDGRVRHSVHDTSLVGKTRGSGIATMRGNGYICE